MMIIDKDLKPNRTYISLDLQFFSAESEGKTEKASPKKREDARKEGQVAKSNELNTAAILLAFFGIMSGVGGMYLQKISGLLISVFNDIPSVLKEGTKNELLKIGISATKEMILLSIPLFGGLFMTGLLISTVQVGFKPTGKAIAPKFSKMNPLKGIKRMFSKDVIVELLKSFIKLVILVSVLISVLEKELYVFFNFYDFSTSQILANISSLVVKMGFNVGGAFLLIAAFDYAYQKFKFEDSIKMSKQDLKEEYKQMEGDPQIKGKIKQRQREMSMKRMMQDIPQADVIITNPTHFAVAIKYDKDNGKAPMVLAKGVDFLAQQIKAKGTEHGIELVENVPLARALYYTCEVGHEISPELYSAVAEVLAYVYQLKEGN